MHVEEDSKINGQSLRELELLSQGDLVVAALIRGDKKQLSPSRDELLQAGDLLLVQGDPSELDELIEQSGLVPVASEGISTAQNLGVNPDTFLMAVAIAASCAFLTPIGHQCNMLVMGPGGYKFRDYWRMGLPLELIILAVATPMLLWVWPL